MSDGDVQNQTGRPARVVSMSFHDQPFETVLRLVDEEAARGADLIALPEAAHGGEVELELSMEREQWSRALTRRFGLEELRDYLARSRREIDARRASTFGGENHVARPVASTGRVG